MLPTVTIGGWSCVWRGQCGGPVQADRHEWKHYLLVITAHKRSLEQGNIFSSMCQEFCSQGGGVCLNAYRDTTPPRAGTPWEQASPLCSAYGEIWSTSRRYAFYWNAIFFHWRVVNIIETYWLRSPSVVTNNQKFIVITRWVDSLSHYANWHCIKMCEN